jgi:TetR/AcrR family transcriptional regulator, copper-responsive repressor
MNSPREKAVRGRPKTLNRETVVEAAMNAYWEDGVDRVSLSEVCRRAGVSKPSVYREFGSEDGLTKAALNRFFELALVPMVEVAVSELSFREKLDAIITFMSADRTKVARPTWCLLVNMRDCAATLGDATLDQIASFRQEVLKAYELMVNMAKVNEQIASTTDSKSAARYIDSQVTNASSQQARGESPKVVREVIELAFSVFDKG